MGQVKNLAIDMEIANQLERKMFLLLCNGKPLALYDHRDTADYEMHICIQGDAYEGEGGNAEAAELAHGVVFESPHELDAHSRNQSRRHRTHSTQHALRCGRIGNTRHGCR